MIKHRVTRILLAVLLLGLLSPLSLLIFTPERVQASITGTGTESDPYVISDVDDLQALDSATYLNKPGIWVELAGNINATVTSGWDGGDGFDPIGDGTSDTFRGTFNGNGYVISDLTINRPTEDYVGLFSAFPCVANVEVNIYNLILTGADIEGDDHVGGLVGSTAKANLYNVVIFGSVEGNDSTSAATGGIAGEAWNCTTDAVYEFVGCYFEGLLTSANGYVGGIAGDVSGTGVEGDTAGWLFENCATDVEIIAASDAAGLIGNLSANATIVNCQAFLYSDATDYIIAGLAGISLTGHHEVNINFSDAYAQIDGTGNTHAALYSGFIWAYLDDDSVLNVEDCFAEVDFTGDITASQVDSHGGFAASLNTADNGAINITRCYSEGVMVGMGDEVGGFVGIIKGTGDGVTITDCYSLVDVDSDDASDPKIGGFSGSVNATGSIDNSYSTGAVTTISGSIYDGGFSGYNVGTITDECFWDTTTSGIGVSDGGTGKITADMKDKDTFTDAEWDFQTVWNIAPAINSGYPFLNTLYYGEPIVSPPVSLLATPVSSSEIYLTWERPDSEETTYTGIWMKEGSYPDDRDDTDAELVYLGDDEAVTVPNLEAGVTYFFHAWTMDTDYTLAESFAGDVDVFTSDGFVDMSSLVVGDSLYIDGATEATVVYTSSHLSTDNNIVTTANDSIKVTTDQVFGTYLLGDEVAEDLDPYYHELWDTNSAAAEPIISNVASTSGATVYSVIHTGDYSYMVVGGDYVRARSLGQWSLNYDEDYALTGIGPSGFVGPDMPPWWFQEPDCTAYEKLPVVYDIIEEFNDTYEVPLPTLCVVFTFFWITIASFVTFLAVKTAPLPIAVMAALIAITSVAGLLPLVFLLLGLLLGGLSIFLWNKVG